MNSHSRNRERGDDTISAVLIFGVLFLVVWAVLQVVVVFLGRNVALEAARDGVHVGRLPPVNTAFAAERARTYTSRVTLGWLSNVDAHADSDGTVVTATVTADAVSFVPFIHFSVSQTASEPVEALP